MELNINELQVILDGLIVLDNVKSFSFSEYGLDYNELYEKIDKEVKSKS